MSDHRQVAEECGKVVVGGDENKGNGSIAESNPPGKESLPTMADPPRTPTNSQQRSDPGDLMWFPEENQKLGSKPISTPPRVEHETKSAIVLSPISQPSPTSRANMRTEKLKGSPPERRGFNKPTLSFGAVVSNVPAPVYTGFINPNFKKLGLGEAPLTHTPTTAGSVSYLGSAYTEQSAIMGTSRGASSQLNSTAWDQYEHPSASQSAKFPSMDDIMGANPYLRRADQIGFRHGVPGMGHLGDSLVPPGWKEGDPPITPGEAKRLFDFARQHAVRELEMNLANQKHRNNEEKEEFHARMDEYWIARLSLDQLVLTERLIIHSQHYERQQRQNERSREQVQPVTQYRLSEVPHPMQLRTANSYVAASPVEPFLGRSSNHQTQIDSRFRDTRMQQTHMAPSMSPSALDRNHTSSRTEEVYNFHQTNYTDLARRALESQQYLNRFPTRDGLPAAQEQRMLPQPVGAPQHAFFEGDTIWTPHHGYVPEQSPLPHHRNGSFGYTSYPHVGSFGVEYPQVNSVGYDQNPYPRPIPYQSTQAGYGGSLNTNIYHSGYDPSLYGHPYGGNPQHQTSQTVLPSIENQPGRGEQFNENRQNEVPKTRLPPVNGPTAQEFSGSYNQETSNEVEQRNYEQAGVVQDRARQTSNRVQHKKVRQPGAAKAPNRETNGVQQTNYKAQLVEPALSGEPPAKMKEPLLPKQAAKPNASKAGHWYENDAEIAKLPASIPSEEFVRAVLEEAERGRGGTKATPRRRRPKPEVDATKGFGISTEAAKLLAAKGVPDRRNSPNTTSSVSTSNSQASLTSIAPAPGGLSTSYNPGPPAKVNFLYSRRHREAATPESENGTSSVEDPNDGDYGKRANRRKTTTPRKNPVSRSNTGSKKKRKSATSSVPNKRSRLSVDAPTHKSDEDAEGSDDPAYGNPTPDNGKYRT